MDNWTTGLSSSIRLGTDSIIDNPRIPRAAWTSYQVWAFFKQLLSYLCVTAKFNYSFGMLTYLCSSWPFNIKFKLFKVLLYHNYQDLSGSIPSLKQGPQNITLCVRIVGTEILSFPLVPWQTISEATTPYSHWFSYISLVGHSSVCYYWFWLCTVLEECVINYLWAVNFSCSFKRVFCPSVKSTPTQAYKIGDHWVPKAGV